jgi:prepilin-type N-terminal cleavage/methylation domain-containing protein
MLHHYWHYQQFKAQRSKSTTMIRVATGFTLPELLIVTAIISLLAAMLFPALAKTRELARRTSCQSNIRFIGMAIRQYAQDYDERLPLVAVNDSEVSPVSKRTACYSWRCQRQCHPLR